MGTAHLQWQPLFSPCCFNIELLSLFAAFSLYCFTLDDFRSAVQTFGQSNTALDNSGQTKYYSKDTTKRCHLRSCPEPRGKTMFTKFMYLVALQIQHFYSFNNSDRL